MPRAGLHPAAVVAAGAALADEVGLANLTMGSLAQRLGVRAPSLYKHVGGQGDLNQRIAALTLSELADAVGAAVQGRAGRDALAAAARAFRAYVVEHPDRYQATLGVNPADPDDMGDPDSPEDPLTAAGRRLIGAFMAVLRGYDIAEADVTHALRAVRSLCHGFATLQATNGFQWSTDIDESFTWLIAFTDRGLRSL